MITTPTSTTTEADLRTSGIGLTSPGDWPEDFADENGCYGHVCTTCGRKFTGHKRRPKVCKVCHDTEGAEIERRVDLVRKAGLNPAHWIIQPRAELERIVGDAMRGILDLHVERKLRRELAEALSRINAAVPRGAVPGAHYALKDGTELVSESRELDAEIAVKEAKRREGRAT